MDFLKLAEERYSVRKFKDEKVSESDLEKILKAGHLAPTGCNNQPQRILVMESDEAIEKLKKCTRCHFGTRTALLVCYNRDEVWVRKYDGKTCGVADASIVTTHMMLEAASIGVGSTWVMHFDPAAMVREFNIPENIRPVALLVMGYPADDAEPLDLHSKYRDMSEVVVMNEF
ncbi:MAG: nitroreductase family protein [Clostridia bacterium]|nr:nitroreductase family protein [Clostridia bacterium]